MALHVPALWAVPSNRTSCRTLTCTVYSVPWMHSSVREVVLRWCGQPGLHYTVAGLGTQKQETGNTTVLRALCSAAVSAVNGEVLGP